jgi:hypothetical protein
VGAGLCRTILFYSKILFICGFMVSKVWLFL